MHRLHPLLVLLALAAAPGFPAGCAPRQGGAPDSRDGPAPPGVSEPVVLRGGERWTAAAAFSPDGRLLAAAGGDGTVRLWDLASRKEAAVFAGHEDGAVAVAFAPDGATLASGSYDRTARLWSVSPPRERRVLRGHRGAVMAVAFAPGRDVIVTAGIDATVRFWETGSGRETAVLAGHRSWVNALSFSAGGETLASGSSDGTVKLWDVATGRERAVWRATRAEVRAVALSPDGTRVAAGLRYGTVAAWEPGRDAVLWSETAHAGDAWAAAFAAGGRVLVTGGGDWRRPGNVKLWDAASGKALGTLEHSGEVLGLAICPPAGLLAAAGADGAVRVWRVEALRGEG